MQILMLTLGMGVLSSVVPIVNMEAYIVALAATMDNPNEWLLALAGGIGQSIGKIPWYEVSRSSLNWAWVKRRMDNPTFQKRFARVVEFTHDRPIVAFGVLFTSSLVAVPPLAITAVLAGQIKMPRTLFHLAIVTGRTIQFTVLLGGAHYLLDN